MLISSNYMTIYGNSQVGVKKNINQSDYRIKAVETIDLLFF